jgi:lipopolysaccharide/colanic/teichoic acid biosynthesis glycosyltransferase
MQESNRQQAWYPTLKRGIDVLGGLVGLLFLFFVFPILAVAIKVNSRGPIFFIQTRVGQYGKKFKFVKFRTMVVDAHQKQWELDNFNETGGVTFKMSNDPRVTSLGFWLRRSSLDETPQFWNVLRGDMSLVGPRPPLIGEVERYNDMQRIRMTVPQGMTGLWQIRGRSGLRFKDMTDLDSYYAKHANLWIDATILGMTLPVVLFGRGAR